MQSIREESYLKLIILIHFHSLVDQFCQVSFSIRIMSFSSFVIVRNIKPFIYFENIKHINLVKFVEKLYLT